MAGWLVVPARVYGVVLFGAAALLWWLLLVTRKRWNGLQKLRHVPGPGLIPLAW
jgi:hypothetical protein